MLTCGLHPHQSPILNAPNSVPANSRLPLSPHIHVLFLTSVSWLFIRISFRLQAVATGDLTQKIIVPVEGQAMTELKDIINSMVDRLKTFAVEVSSLQCLSGSTFPPT